MPSPPLPLLLQKEDSVVLAVYDEASNTLTEQKTNEPAYQGDYTECTVAFHPVTPTCFAHATTTKLFYSQVVRHDAAAALDQRFGVKTLFEAEMPHVILKSCFSPKGRFLVTYAMMDPKRSPDGNLCIFDTATGKRLRQCMQGAWPAVVWSAAEEFLVRWTQGGLQVHPGHLLEHEEPLLSRMDLMLSKDQEIDFHCSPAEGFPLLSLFKPIEKNRPASFSIFRLPKLEAGEALFQIGFGRAEAATSTWSPSGKHVALLVKQGSGGSNPHQNGSPNSYYGSLTLHLVDVLKRSMKDVKIKPAGSTNNNNNSVGGGDVVHDCRWAPHSDELLVIHGNMPRNKATILNTSGVALMTFGEGPRNMALWSPDGATFMVGGSGNLAGDYQFYAYGGTASPTSATPMNRKLSTGVEPAAGVTKCVGDFSEKCSMERWAPDSHHLLFSTIFTRLRVDNKLVIAKKNGARMLTEKFKALYGAYWVETEPSYPARVASPRPSLTENPKPQAYRPPGGTSVRAAALLRGPDATSATAVKTAGALWPQLAPKKKGKRR